MKGVRKTEVHINAKDYIAPSNCGHKWKVVV